MVEIDADGIKATLKQDYYQRSIVRLQLQMRTQDAIEKVTEEAIALIQKSLKAKTIIPADQPIVELRIHGTVGFDRLELNTKALQKQLQEQCNALIFFTAI